MKRNHLFSTFRLVLVFLGWSSSDTFAQGHLEIKDTNSVECVSEVEILHNGTSQSLCLNHFNPSGDSCARMEIVYVNLGVTLDFFYEGHNHEWKFNDQSNSAKNQSVPVSISVITTENEKLTHVLVEFGKKTDSSALFIDLSRIGDIPYVPDSTKPFDYILNINRFLCQETPKQPEITVRAFTYPGGYMHREPKYNYPELSAFHWGKSVTMPSAGSVVIQAYTKNYWHLLKMPKLSYDDPECINKGELYRTRWEKRHPPKKKKKRSSIPLLRIKPL